MNDVYDGVGATSRRKAAVLVKWWRTIRCIKEIGRIFVDVGGGGTDGKATCKSLFCSFLFCVERKFRLSFKRRTRSTRYEAQSGNVALRRSTVRWSSSLFGAISVQNKDTLFRTSAGKSKISSVDTELVVKWLL
ncbi:unnamed protein product [Haemonchus placei]|uniref:Uncharacterized protein n=1 Tax=Haemonchus placei TaxID=6290 RepID=A0A0N4W0T2_HAEPC|nr:unnamed protein product [Haemonchus placei]